MNLADIPGGVQPRAAIEAKSDPQNLWAQQRLARI